MKISSSFLAKAADVKISLEANSKTLLAKKVASHPSLAAKEKRSYGSQKTIQGHFNDPDAPHQIKSTSCFLGFILCLCLLLHGPASWLSSSEFQNRVWKKIEITAKPAQNLALQATELQQTKVNLGYDIASGSSVYCNGDPVNGLDPDGRCVESTLNAVPGQAAWQQSVSSFNNGDYGQATLSFGFMLSEQALTVATFGMGSVASAGGEMASSVAAETVGNAEAGATVNYGPMNLGPLANDIMSTFRSGSYTAQTLKQPTSLYRVIGESGNTAGSYWTSMQPQGPLQSLIDLGLDQSWGNTATRVIRANIPAGTRIYEGAAAAQGGLVGGGNQIYIPKVNPNWIF